MMNIISCRECGRMSMREEEFFDLQVQVPGLGGLDESVAQFFEMEGLVGDNQYFCEQCDRKVDADKGVRLDKLPTEITFNLMRFALDFETWQRYKVHTRFAYPLQIDIRPFMLESSVKEDEEYVYELKSVLIHSGNAYGGHYHAYIRDTLGEGEWYRDLDLEAQRKK